MLPPVCLGDRMKTDTNQNFSRMQNLHAEAMQLPERPGVYIMRDASDKIIYVGKSRNLKNRVSQYFGNTKKTLRPPEWLRQSDDSNVFTATPKSKRLPSKTLSSSNTHPDIILGLRMLNLTLLSSLQPRITRG